MIARDPAVVAPDRMRRVAAALWVALVSACVPVLLALVLWNVADIFGLFNQRLLPVLDALVASLVGIGVALGLARGLFAPETPNWRLLAMSDRTARKLTRAVVAATVTLFAQALLAALGDAIAVTLSTSIAIRAAGTLALVLVIMHLVLSLGDGGADEACLGPKVPVRRDWSGPLRLIGFVVTAVALAATVVGYVAFAGFLMEQVLALSLIVSVVFLAFVMAEEGIATAVKPTTPFGRAVTSHIGLRREAMDQIAILATGLLQVVLIGVAVLLALAPWRIESGDLLGTVRAAFFGFQIGDLTISLSTILIALTLFVGGVAATRTVQRWLEKRYLPLTHLDAGLQNSIKTSLGYVGFVIAASLGLSHLGVSFERLAIVAGALSVGIGFGLQSIVNNFVSGLILLWERAIRVGDWIVVGEEQGYIRRINVRSTEIETFDRATVIVPNSNLITGMVKNLVRTDRVGRLRIAVNTHNGADPAKVREVLIACAKGHEQVLKLPAPQLLFLDFTESLLKFELVVFIDDVETSMRVRSDLHFGIYAALKQADIPIAPPAPPPPTMMLTGLDKLETLLAAGQGTRRAG